MRFVLMAALLLLTGSALAQQPYAGFTKSNNKNVI
jgi:hypothetical protein